jgi:putative nucleotidyltransferase with HDIG domain
MAALSSPPTVTALLDAADRLGLFPTAAIDIFDTLRDPEVDGRKLAAVIGRDPVLTARILKVANSPFYGRAQRIGTIAQALVLMGLPVVRDLTVSFALVAMSKQASPAVGAQWQHMLSTGVLCAGLARVVRTVDAASAMVVGTLHDIGELIMLEVEPQRHGQVLARMRPDDPRITLAERIVFGIDHAELGAACVMQWGLPPTYAAVVRDHHVPIVERGLPLASVLQLADAAVGLLERGVKPEVAAEDLAECPANAWLSLTAPTIRQCLGRLSADRRDLLG